LLSVSRVYEENNMVQVIADSCASIPDELVKQLGIQIVVSFQ
jgi:hypothetical protein